MTSCKLTLAIFGGEWSATCPDCCPSGEKPCTHFTVGWVGPTVIISHSEYEKMLLPLLGIEYQIV
jgi:hypothetical protein